MRETSSDLPLGTLRPVQQVTWGQGVRSLERDNQHAEAMVLLPKVGMANYYGRELSTVRLEPAACSLERVLKPLRAGYTEGESCTKSIFWNG